MRRGIVACLGLLLAGSLLACSVQEESSADIVSRQESEISMPETDSNIVVAYAPQEEDMAVSRAAEWLQTALGADLKVIGEDTQEDYSRYEFVFLGFEAQDNVLPEVIQRFLSQNDLGARTIYSFVAGDGNDASGIYAAISALQPGALLGTDMLTVTENTDSAEAEEWALGLGLSDEGFVPQAGDGNTVATATVTPGAQQVLYLWEEGNVPATTEYTVNHGGYSDDPDFRPYLTSFPVPEGTEIEAPC